MKISVIGCGRWGTFLAWYVSQKYDAVLWGRENSKHLQRLKETRQNEYLTLRDNIELTSDLDYVMQNEFIIISILTQEVRGLLQTLKKYDLSNKKFILCMKGIESDTGKRLSEILIENGIPKEHIAIWVGPGHVQNFVNGIPNCMLIDSHDEHLTKELVEMFSTKLIRFYYGYDILGAEIGACAKNVLGIAAGMLDGLGMSSLKGALMTRGTREVSRLVEALGGDKMTPYGLSHLGDFEATLFSQFSHNRAWGESFVKGETFEKSAEGVGNILGLLTLSKKVNVEMPITQALYNIVFEHKDIKTEFENMLLRRLKKEFID